MINRTRLYLVFIIIFLIPFHRAYGAPAEKTAVVIKSQNLSAYNEVIKGFKDECIQNNINIKSIYDLNGKMQTGHKVVRKTRKESPDIVLTIGVLAATVVKEKIRDIPIIFCMVINHERFQLAGPNITGIATEIAIEDQLKGYQSILRPIQNIGVVYDPSKTGNIIKDAELKMKGLGINLAKYEIKSSGMIREAMEDLIGRIDAMWLLPDSTVVTRESFDFIKSATLKNKIPLLCTSDVFVKAGALAAVFSDYKFIGENAARLAGEILEPSAPELSGIVNPDKYKLAINAGTAEELGIELKAVAGKPNVIIYP